MGDTGSLFLGSYLVSLIFNTPSIIEALKIIFLCTPLLQDPVPINYKKINK